MYKNLQAVVALALVGVAAVPLEASVQSEARPAHSAADVVEPGADPAAWLELLDRTDILVVGETHGSLEAPGVVLAATDAALEFGTPAILALEIWASEQSRVEAYLASDGGDKARSGLLAGVFWTGTEDGRSSRAMYDVIEAIRERVSRKMPVGVLCFDDSVNGTPESRDRSMARAVLRSREQRPDTKYVVLAGNWHTRSVKPADQEEALAPMAWHLRQAKARVHCVKLRTSGGEFWCCIDEGCGVHRFGGEGPASGGGLKLLPERDGNGYDATFDLGPVNASPPAVSEAVNTNCPRSGKPIGRSFLAHYRGRLVGFCNAHCRDDFAAHVDERPDDRSAFDALIEARR